MKKDLVLVGGGHAHMMTLDNISEFVDQGFRVTVIGPSPFHYYSGMGPGMLGGTYTPDDIRFATKKVVEMQGGIFVQDKAASIDPDQRKVFTQEGKTIAYDVLSLNAGSHVPVDPVVEQGSNIYSVKPIEKLMEAGDKLTSLFAEKEGVVSIVGGGPSSAEVAGNVWQLSRQVNASVPTIRIFAGRKFMAKFPETIRNKVMSTLAARKIEIIEKGYATSVTPDEIRLDSNEKFVTDFVFMALGVKPSTMFEASGLPVGPDKGLLVNGCLQSVKYPEIFGGGDCIYFRDTPLDKVGVYAVRQNPVLLHNLMAHLKGDELKTFDPGPEYLLIFNLGGSVGVLKKKGLVLKGKIPFMIKDYIDRKFMKEFQAMEKK